MAGGDPSDLPASPRLRFGRWQAGDGARAAALWGDPRVTALTGGPFLPRQVADRLAAEVAGLAAHGVQYWPILDRADGGFLGCCGLRPRDPATATFELGYQLLPEAAGRGLATEAARAVIAWARGHGVAALIAGHHPDNHASARILARLGFVWTHDEFYPPTGLMEPCYQLALDRPD